MSISVLERIKDAKFPEIFQSKRKQLVLKWSLQIIVILQLYAIVLYFMTRSFAVEGEIVPSFGEFNAEIWRGFLSTTTFKETLIWAFPILMTAMGATFNERAGVVNIGLEGIMVFASWAGIFFTYSFGNYWLGLLGAILFGTLLALVHAIMTITFKADQIVIGVAINLFALGLTSVLTAIIWRPGRSDEVPKIDKLNLFELPVIGNFLKAIQFKNYYEVPILGDVLQFIPDPIGIINRQNYLLFIGLLLIPVCHYILFKTPFGLRIRAIGENPQAAATAGIPVHRYQYYAVLISGVLASIGGAFMTMRFGLFAEGTVQGEGFIGLVAMIFGKWTIIGSVLAALFFGYFIFLSSGLKLYGRVSQSIPDPLLKIFPYFIAMVALALIGKSRAPKHIGKPYDPSED